MTPLERLSQPWIRSSKKVSFVISVRVTTRAGSYSARLISARESGWERFVCLQPQYNLLCRSTEWEMVPVALREGLGVIPWSSLRGGWLSGEFRRGMTEPPKGSRIEVATEKGWGEAWQHYNTESTWRLLMPWRRLPKESGKRRLRSRSIGFYANRVGRRQSSERGTWNSSRQTWPRLVGNWIPST